MTIQPLHSVVGDAPADGATAPRTAPSRVRRLEAVETRAWLDFYRTAPEDVKSRAGLGVHRVDGLVLGIAPAFDALAFNRVIGGDVPPDPARLDSAVALARRRGVPRLFVPWPPHGPEPAVEAELDRRGIRRHNRWVKLWRGTEPPPEESSGLAVEELQPRHRGEVQELMVACFDYPRPLALLFGATVGAEGWRHFGIRHDGRLVAGAGLRIDADAAWFGPAGTRRSFRRRGAQTALLAHRVRAALDAGCRLLCTETAEPTPDRPAASFRNVRRAGFRVAYRRPNFVTIPAGRPSGPSPVDTEIHRPQERKEP